MFIRITLLLLLTLTRIAQCQIDTSIGTCSCDLTRAACDATCCCDPDCSLNDMKTFNCDSKSTIQSTCFKDISIYKSNSPHVVQKNGDLVCVDYQRKIDANTAKMINAQIDPSVLPRSINIDNSVSLSVGTPTDLSIYQAGTSVFRYISSANTSTYYSLPVKLFNSQTCGGSQPITYLNNFASTCNQPVNSQTCVNELDTTKYLSNNFCLVPTPSALAQNGTNLSSICCNGNGSLSSWTSPNCINALRYLALTIYYSNSGGIVNCTVYLDTTTGTLGSLVTQTLTVNFIKSGSSLSNTLRSGNPGYIPGNPIIAGSLNGNIITTISTGLTILQASSAGGCSGTNAKVISFGQNVQSTCLYTPSTTGTCLSLNTVAAIFMPYGTSNLNVAGKGSSDPTNSSDSWISVTFCTSQIGSTNAPVCQSNSLPSSTAGQCYARLDIQITFANFGSVTNPQPIIGAVVYNFQSTSQVTTTSTAVLLTQTVTYQDVSNSPVVQGDQLPRPNVRLPGDFFYPFTLNRAATPMLLSSVFYLLIFFVFLGL